MQTVSYVVEDVYSLWGMSVDCEISLCLYMSFMVPIYLVGIYVGIAEDAWGPYIVM